MKVQASYKKAFTLLELMVVVAIIGILTAIGLVTYTTIQTRGRDVRRIEDMKTYQNAQEQYYAQHNAYEISGACTVTGILSSAVTDPKGTDPYIYDCDTYQNADYYCACAELEDNARGNGASCDCATLPCTINSGTTHFCVVHLQ